MANLHSRLMLSIRDGVSAPARAIRGQLASLQNVAGAVQKRIGSLEPQVRRLQRVQNGVGFTSSFGAYMLIQGEVEYQRAMNRTRAIALASVSDMRQRTAAFEEHRDIVIDLARRSPLTSREIATGMSELAMTGMSLQTINEIAESAVDGAVASGERIATVAAGVTDIMMAMARPLNKSNFDYFNNVLLAASTSYNDTYVGFLDGMRKAAPLAELVGLNLQQLTALHGTIANAGYKGARGGTALRTGLLYMAAPDKKARSVYQAYGIDLGRDEPGALNRDLMGRGLGGQAFSAALQEIGVPYEEEMFRDIEAYATALFADKTLSMDRVRELLQQETLQYVKVFSEDYGVQFNASEVADVVDNVMRMGSSSVDMMSRLRELAQTNIVYDTAALQSLFKTRFVAPWRALLMSMRTMVEDPDNPGQMISQFDLSERTQNSRVQGATERFTQEMQAGIVGTVTLLEGAWDSLLRGLGNSYAFDILGGVLTGLRGVIEGASELHPAILGTVAVSVLLLGVLAPLGFAITMVGSGVATLASLFSVAGSAAFVMGRIALKPLSWMLGDATKLVTGLGAAFRALIGLRLGAAIGGLVRTIGGFAFSLLGGVVWAMFDAGMLDPVIEGVKQLWAILDYTVFQDLQGGWDMLASWGANAASGLYSAFIAALSGVATFAGQVFRRIMAWWTGDDSLLQQMSGRGGEGMLIQGVYRPGEDGGLTLANAEGEVAAGSDGFWDGMVSTLWKRFLNAMQSAYRYVVDGVRGFVSRAAAWLRRQSNAIVQGGSDAADGLKGIAENVRERAGSVATFTREVADLVVESGASAVIGLTYAVKVFAGIGEIASGLAGFVSSAAKIVLNIKDGLVNGAGRAWQMMKNGFEMLGTRFALVVANVVLALKQLQHGLIRNILGKQMADQMVDTSDARGTIAFIQGQLERQQRLQSELWRQHVEAQEIYGKNIAANVDAMRGFVIATAEATMDTGNEALVGAIHGLDALSLGSVIPRKLEDGVTSALESAGVDTQAVTEYAEKRARRAIDEHVIAPLPSSRELGGIGGIVGRTIHGLDTQPFFDAAEGRARRPIGEEVYGGLPQRRESAADRPTGSFASEIAGDEPLVQAQTLSSMRGSIDELTSWLASNRGKPEAPTVTVPAPVVNITINTQGPADAAAVGRAAAGAVRRALQDGYAEPTP